MIVVTCIDRSCGVEFGIPEHVNAQAHRDHERRVHCPNGHPFVYKTSEPQRLREHIESLEREVADARRSLDHWIKMERYWRGRAHRKSRAGR